MSPLWQFLEGIRKIPIVVLGLGAVQLLARFATGLPVRNLSIFIALLAGVAGLAQLLLRSGRTTVRRILASFQLAGWPFAISLAMFEWSIAQIATAGAVLKMDPLVIGLASLPICMIFAALQILPRAALRLQYAQLGEFRRRGGIGENQLAWILSFGASGHKWQTVTIVLVGLASTATGVAKIAYGSHVVGIAISSAMMFGIAPYIAGILIARLILQGQYLGVDDLLIEGSSSSSLLLREF